MNFSNMLQDRLNKREQEGVAGTGLAILTDQEIAGVSGAGWFDYKQICHSQSFSRAGDSEHRKVCKPASIDGE
jgi:hypothetical protein